MQIQISRSTLSLARDGLVAIRDGQGTAILCHDGSLWITQEGDVKDAVISAGECLRIRCPGLTLVTALGPSELTIIEPGEPEPRQSPAEATAKIKSESVPCL